MDANGTRYHLTLGESDWGRWRDSKGAPLSQAWDAQRAGEVAWNKSNAVVSLPARVFQFPTAAADKALTLDARRGAAMDSHGNAFRISADGSRILSNKSGVIWPRTASHAEPRPGAFRDVDSADRPEARRFAGIAITKEHYLVAGCLDPASVLIFDLLSSAAPVELRWPEDVAFEPFAIAALGNGGFVVLDRQNRRYWTVDRHWQIDTAPTPVRREPCGGFHDAGGQPRGSAPEPAYLGTPVAAVDPIAIEALPGGELLILDRDAPGGFSRIFRYKNAAAAGPPLSLDVIRKLIDTGDTAFRLIAHDFIFAPGYLSPDGEAKDLLFVASVDGNQSYAFELAEKNGAMTLEPWPAFYPMRLFSGAALAGFNGRVFYSQNDAWLPLVEQKRPRFANTGAAVSPMLDGKAPGCVWHRLFLDGCIPASASIRVWTRAADDPETLSRLAWRPEPAPYKRSSGSELPFLDSNRETWELLFQNATGRYTEIKLEWSGDGRTTPRIHALRAYYGRFSYPAAYLPPLYRDDEVSAGFLDRFLANMEGFYTALEDRMVTVERLFDPSTVTRDAVEWLGSWLGLAMDPGWDEERRRLLIRHAMRFYAMRGTRGGLVAALRLTLDSRVDDNVFSGEGNGFRLIEHFRLLRTSPIALGAPVPELELIAPSSWKPSHGRQKLHDLYNTERPGARGYPVRRPAQHREEWEAFSKRVLGFVPVVGSKYRGQWRDFLARRYPSVTHLNAAHGSQWAALAQVKLPRALPRDGAALKDWVEFHSIVLAARRLAHTFTLLIPAEGTNTTPELERRKALAARILDLEKPAHTRFNIKLFWAALRGGLVRLGADTPLGPGGRAVHLMQPVVLGESYLSEAYLDRPFPAGARRENLDCRRLENCHE